MEIIQPEGAFKAGFLKPYNDILSKCVVRQSFRTSGRKRARSKDGCNQLCKHQVAGHFAQDSEAGFRTASLEQQKQDLQEKLEAQGARMRPNEHTIMQLRADIENLEAEVQVVRHFRQPSVTHLSGMDVAVSLLPWNSHVEAFEGLSRKYWQRSCPPHCWPDWVRPSSSSLARSTSPIARSD